MRRLAPIAILLPLVLAAVGCSTSKPGGKIVDADAADRGRNRATVPTAAVPAQYKNGDATAGKAVFKTAGCTGCHTLKDAGSTGTVGPNLDDAKPPLSLAVTARDQGRGRDAVLQGQLSDKQIADVTAYVVKASGGNPNG